jgi:hypothetical protein
MVENMNELVKFQREKITDLTKQLAIAKKGRKMQKAV